MSYSIREGVDDARKRLSTFQAIAKKYPDATMQDLPSGDQVWMSASASKDVTGLMAVADKSGQVFLCPFVEVAGSRVYSGHFNERCLYANTTLAKLDKATLLSLIKKRNAE